MQNKNNKFIYSIVAPTILAISMFIFAFYLVIIPMFERSMMDRKEEMIVELTNAAWSVMAEYNDAHNNGDLSLAEAKEKAADHIGKMRYGEDQKDYFWIISSGPKMIMHPYRTDLIGRDLSDYTDNHENKLFVDAVQLVNDKGAGITQYYWQWKDDPSKIVPKLSYVKGFPEWQWIIGTGIYLQDVQLEIKKFKKRLWVISFFISLFITLILIYVLRQTKIIEEKRKAAEYRLRLSIQKYKSLVEASSDGTLMVADERVIFANTRFINLLNEDCQAVKGAIFSNVFAISWQGVLAKIDDPKKTYSFETQLLNAKAGMENVVVSVTQITNSIQIGYILVVKNVTESKQLRLDARKLSDDVELSLQLMNQQVLNLVNKNVCCDLTDTIKEAAEIMSANQSKLLCIKQNEEVIGVLTDADLRSRVLAKGEALDKPVYAVMTSPVNTINQNALLHEAVLLFKQQGISHLLVENNIGRIFGNISNQQCLEMQRNSVTYLIREIDECTVISSLKRIYNRLPLLVQAVFTSADNINGISRIITSVADAINIRVIKLALKELGEPPCDFAFIAMGSEGRGEQTLKTDQDNAIIFDDSTEETKGYFLALSEIINESLHAIGYARCKGDLMAGNPEWCNPLSVWKECFSVWINNPDIKNVLDSSIFFDLRLIYGSESLVQQLQAYVHDTLEGNTLFFNQLAKTLIQQKPLIEKKQVNIKNLLLPIIAYLRIYALKHAIPETNSMLRLNQLMGYGFIPEMTGQEIEKMYKFLMHLRIRWQVTLILDNDRPKNHVPLSNLNAIDKVSLEKILQQICKLQDGLRKAFKITE